MRGWRVGLIEIVNRRDTSQDKQDNLEITLSQIRTNVKVFAVIFFVFGLELAVCSVCVESSDSRSTAHLSETTSFKGPRGPPHSF